ncbi:type IV toxin-antitoxin system AbiEi family antitoxin domain-containing protein [Nocardioides euryhalodurans]|uniref:AbiEi antitoxin N-terminal domain-containing protein n=1 Tax=Nocardioides euryhalodurans TaxID=2518370 RepID=A0A4P7GN67_9ACTN|nr:type IV toxin-antitoxin system AbiEi family antitoxin domain-containing protein [Nocardioides euryhalodurans]QBR93231.1 hypothetical protein EXE57_13895 [Nocardioides euryhalodurans]
MESRVVAAVARTGGLTTTADLVRAGIEPRFIARLVRTGRLVAVRRGVYTTDELWTAWDEHRARPMARVRAAELCIAVAHVSSHDSAALAHELPLLRPQESAVHISRLDMRGTRVQNGVEHHGARFAPDEVTVVDGLRVLDIPRTVADLAREHGYLAGLVAADGAMQRGVSRAQLQEAAARMEGWPFSRTVKQVLDNADPGAESVGETLARDLADESGLGPIETQFPVRTPRGVAWVDLRIGRHLVEFDGRVKYRSVEEGGLRDGDLERMLWDERRRQDEICRGGFGMTRLVYADFWGDRRDDARIRLVREQAASTARYGTELSPEMQEFADRVRGRRHRVVG